MHGRKYGPRWAAFDAELPPVPGWPRHPLAPTQMDASQLERDSSALFAELERAKAQRHEEHAGALRRRIELTTAELQRVRASRAASPTPDAKP